MNYRHIFHAGNRCDVVKHAVLTLVLVHLRQKEKPFAVIDTHAGVGLYDLLDTRALKTNEASEGIKDLLNAAPLPALTEYHTILRKINPLWDGTGARDFRSYPGSPLIAYHMLRERDRLVACELHPEDADGLRVCLPKDKRVQIHKRNGYEALSGLLPPPEKRGLVLIDPPYESPDEFEKVAQEVIAAKQRWPTGIYMIWYPIKDRPAIWNLQAKLGSAGIGNILSAEFIYEEETRSDRLNGSGLLILNAPWKLDEQLEILFPALHNAMHSNHKGTVVRYLVT